MNHSIKHLFHIDSPIEDVFDAISTIDGLSQWWTKETTGSATKGGILKFKFGSHGAQEMKVTGIVPNQSISWECVGSPHGWVGHTFTFKLDRNDEKTRVRFSHDGWKEADDFYAICTFSWGRYLESLRQLCQTGVGEGFGTDNYRR